MTYKKPGSNTTYLITGAAGFIGYYLSRNPLEKRCRVVGIDNMNDYYDVRLKEKRLELLVDYDEFTFLKVDISDKKALDEVFEKYQPEIVVNLAAQAGVRYSITNPDAYIQSNLIGFYNILECCRHSYDEGNAPVEHLLYPVARFMAQIRRRLIRWRIRRIIRFPCMPRPRRAMSYWRYRIRNSITSRQRVCASLRSMVRWAGRIWRIMDLPRKSSLVSQSRFLIMRYEAGLHLY